MKISEVMTRKPEVVRPDATIQDAARKMDEFNIGSLPVCDGERLVGMITDRDITVRATAAGCDPKTTLVGDAMSQDVICCYEDQDVREAAELMKQKQVRRLLVLDRADDLVGIVSLGDLATEAGDQGQPGEVLREVSEPT